MAAVRIASLAKRFGGVSVIEGLDLEIEDHEFMVLVGPSGCGKSTVLRMIAGLEEVSGGTISIGGRVVNDVAPKKRDVAMVFQNYALYPHMTVRQNMAFGVETRGLARAEIARLVGEAAEVLGLSELLDRKPRQLSGGQRQRVAVGRAIVRQPAVFLFDEPLSNLDAKLRVQMRAEIKRLQQRLGITSVYVTHDQVEAMTMGSRICVLNRGKLQQVGAPLEVYARPANAFVAQFIGTPPMNLLRGRLVDGGAAVTLGARRLAVPAALRAETAGRDGAPVIVGFRPEDVHLAGEAGGRDAAAGAEALMEIVETLGHEVVIHARLGDEVVVFRESPQRAPAPGTQAGIRFDLAQMHLFDGVTEARIG